MHFWGKYVLRPWDWGEVGVDPRFLNQWNVLLSLHIPADPHEVNILGSKGISIHVLKLQQVTAAGAIANARCEAKRAKELISGRNTST
eukprot:2743048-Amphidinium_carterae.1